MVSSSGTDSIVAEVGRAWAHPAPAPTRQTQAARHIPRTTMAHLARFQTPGNPSHVPLITVIPRPRAVNKVIAVGSGAEASQNPLLPPDPDSRQVATLQIAAYSG